MAEIDVQNDLDAVNNQIETFAEELRKKDAARQNIVTQITNLNGVSMNLRGKLATDDIVEEEAPAEDNLERTSEYPEETS